MLILYNYKGKYYIAIVEGEVWFITEKEQKRFKLENLLKKDSLTTHGMLDFYINYFQFKKEEKC